MSKKTITVNNTIRQPVSRKIFNVFNVLFMCALVVVMIFPYINILAKAFNNADDTAMGGITVYPRVFTWKNFETVVSDTAFPRAALVSVIKTVLGALIAVSVQFLAAYAFQHKDLYGKKGLLMFLMIPAYFGGGLIPCYIYFSNTGVLNNWALYLLPSAFSLYNMIIIRSYMDTLPASLSEAACLDGASEFQIFSRVTLPLCKPILATVALWSAVGHWSDYSTTMYYFTDKKKFTLQYLLYQVLKETEKIEKMMQEALMRGDALIGLEQAVSPESVRCAQIIVTTVPIVICYPFLQKYFIQGVTLGAVKD